MRSPVVAMLWENWRLTRVEAAFRLAIGIVAGSLLLAVAATAPTETARGMFAAAALAITAWLHSMLWLSIAKLNGGKFLDGYHPGFPLHLLYTRPLSTAMLVGVPMAYAAAMAAALYLGTAVLLRLVFGYPLPALPIAAWIVAIVLVQAAMYWSTRDRIVQWVGTTIGYLACMFLAIRRAAFQDDPGPETFHPTEWSAVFAFSWVDLALIVAIALLSFGLTAIGVARQRRGDARPAPDRAASRSGSPDWFAALFQIRCPTSSRTWAQVWFEFRASGLGVLHAGLLFALAIPLLSAIAGPVAVVRPFFFFAPVFAVLTVLASGGNAFGIRRKQGRTYVSLFEATQASATASLAALKVLTRTVCVLAALGMIGVSVWIAIPLVGEWPGVGREATNLQSLRDALDTSFATLTVAEQIAVAVITFFAVAGLVAARATFEALLLRYRRPVLATAAVVLLFNLAFVLNVLAADRSDPFVILLDVLVVAAVSLAALAIVLAAGYLVWRTVAEQLLTLLQMGGVIVIAAVFAAAWKTLLNAAGLPLAGIATDAVYLLPPALLLVTAGLLAPWSLNRVRHL